MMMEEESNKENEQIVGNDGVNSSFEIIEEEEGSSEEDESDTPLEDEDPLSDEVTSSSQQQHQMMEIESMTSNGSQENQQQPLLLSNISEVQVKADSSSNGMEYEDVEISNGSEGTLVEASCSSLSSSSSDQSNNDNTKNTNNVLEQHQDTDFSMFFGNPAFKYPKAFTNYGDGERRERKTYKCWYCPTVHFLRSNYLVHKQRHLTESHFKCSTCSFSCDTNTALQNHSICHKYQCKTARATTITTKRSLANNNTAVKRKLMTSSTSTAPKKQLVTLVNQIEAGHVESTTKATAPKKRIYVRGGATFKCTDVQCPGIFDRHRQFESHMKCHTNSNVGWLACHLCTYKANNSYIMTRHISKHNGDKSEAASNEHDVLKNKIKKRKPLNVSTTAAPENQVTLHDQVEDNIVESTTTTPNPTKRTYKPRRTNYKCKDPKCPGDLFKKLSDFKKHLAMHSNSNDGWNYACHLCTYKANFACNMRTHNLRHANNSELSYNHDVIQNRIQKSPFKSLTRGTSKLGVVRGQIMPEEKKFKCTLCPDAFSRVRALEAHKNRHSDVNGRNKCKFCTYSVFALKFLRRHELLHRKNATSSSVTQGNIYNIEQSAGGLSISVRPAKSTRLVQAFGSRHRPYRRGLIIPRRKSKVNLSARRRGDPVKDGYLTQKELDEIKLGNPKFKYNDTYTFPSGKVITTRFRCLMCPKSFLSYTAWRSHQNSTHSNSNSRRKPQWEQTNTMRSSQSGQIIPITKTEPNTPSPNIVKNNCSSVKSPITHTPTNSANSSAQKPSNSLGRGYNLQIKPKRKIELPEADETDYLFEDANKSGHMIVGLKINNFMMIADKEIKSLNKTLCELRDERNSGGGKTTTIVALLIGLGYDLLLGSLESSTLCGVDISSVLRQGTTSGYVEVTLNLKSSEELVKRFGEQLILHRGFTAGTSVSNSKLEIRYGNDVSEEISKSQLLYLINNLLPTFLLRLMVLNPENIEYLAHNFHICDEIFMTLLESKKTTLLVKAREIRNLIDSFKEDLDSREERITFLKSSLLKKAVTPRLRQLQVQQTAELKTALEINADVLNTHNNLIRTESILIARVSDQLVELINQMRNPFRKYLHAQNYVGDILINNNGQGLVVWMKETNFSTLQTAHTTLDEAKQIWKSLTIGRRKLAIIGLYVAFWEIMDCCPVMVSDSYSNSELEFKFPEAALPVLLAFLKGHEKSSRQFFLTLPNTE